MCKMKILNASRNTDSTIWVDLIDETGEQYCGSIVPVCGTINK